MTQFYVAFLVEMRTLCTPSPHGGLWAQKKVSDGVFEKRQIRFKLTAIVIQVEVSLHILPTIAEHHIHIYYGD